MITPPPPAQDCEREQLPDLRCDETKFWHAQIDKREEDILTQSAELAALRAQVEGLRKDAERYRGVRCEGTKLPRLNSSGIYVTFNIGHDWIQEYDKDAFDAAVDAALAPPQPVAKETKP